MTPVLLAVALLGAGIVAISSVALAVSGARPGLARRLAGPRGMGLPALLEAARLPDRPVRIRGRIRCGDPLRGDGDARLVAVHRDLELRTARGWRTIERVRQTRSFELWDRTGSVVIDPALAAEPLIAIPHVWRGSPSQLDASLAAAVGRVAERDGPILEARAVTRSISVTDDVSVLARPRRDESGRLRVEPPGGGFVITNLELDDAMRLLGGRRRRLGALAVVGIGLGAAMAVVGGGAALVLSIA